MATSAEVVHFEGARERLRLPASALGHAGFRAWVTASDFPRNVRPAFIRGEVFLEMSPESIESHNKVKVEVTSVLSSLVKRHDLGELYGDRTLLTHEEVELSTEPDAAFASWETLSSGRLRLVPRAGRDDEYIEIVGTPDLVVEILSDSSVRKDLTVLRDAYFRARIPEYWLIDARGEDVRFEILSLGSDGYEARSASGAPQRSDVLGRVFRLERRRNRAGRWSYDLSVLAQANE
jgi:Uma2 family endonuclease